MATIFFAHGLLQDLAAAAAKTSGAKVFGYHVSDPKRYGLANFYVNETVKAIIEKPEVPLSNYAVKRLYFIDGTEPEHTNLVKPSARGEFEITSLLETYLQDGNLHFKKWAVDMHPSILLPTPRC